MTRAIVARARRLSHGDGEVGSFSVPGFGLTLGFAGMFLRRSCSFRWRRS
jgi:hypothetical protein